MLVHGGNRNKLIYPDGFKEKRLYYKHWNGLSRELVKSPSMETFKIEKDKAQSTLI